MEVGAVLGLQAVGLAIVVKLAGKAYVVVVVAVVVVMLVAAADTGSERVCGHASGYWHSCPGSHG